MVHRCLVRQAAAVFDLVYGDYGDCPAPVTSRVFGPEGELSFSVAFHRITSFASSLNANFSSASLLHCRLTMLFAAS
jgi:hypothetical protein